MAIRVIYNDKNTGHVNESRLCDLIRAGRIAAFCRPDDEWVGVKNFTLMVPPDNIAPCSGNETPVGMNLSHRPAR